MAAETITANQAFVASGSSKSFADWLQEAKDSGLIKEGEGILASLFKKDAPKPTTTTTVPIATDKIMGMPKPLFYGITAVLVIGAGVFIYKTVTKKK